MPQFDTITFFNQLFYFTFVFFCFYFFILGTVTPKITLTLKTRSKKLFKDAFSSVLLKNEFKLITDSFDKQFLTSTFNLATFVDNNCSINKVINLKYVWVNNYSKLKLNKITTLKFLKVSAKLLLVS
jgi:hypothetical protein